MPTKVAPLRVVTANVQSFPEDALTSAQALDDLTRNAEIGDLVLLQEIASRYRPAGRAGVPGAGVDRLLRPPRQRDPDRLPPRVFAKVAAGHGAAPGGPAPRRYTTHLRSGTGLGCELHVLNLHRSPARFNDRRRADAGSRRGLGPAPDHRPSSAGWRRRSRPSSAATAQPPLDADGTVVTARDREDRCRQPRHEAFTARRSATSGPRPSTGRPGPRWRRPSAGSATGSPSSRAPTTPAGSGVRRHPRRRRRRRPARLGLAAQGAGAPRDRLRRLVPPGRSPACGARTSTPCSSTTAGSRPRAAAQVAAYRAGRDGLKGNRADTFWRPAARSRSSPTRPRQRDGAGARPTGEAAPKPRPRAARWAGRTRRSAASTASTPATTRRGRHRPEGGRGPGLQWWYVKATEGDVVRGPDVRKRVRQARAGRAARSAPTTSPVPTAATRPTRPGSSWPTPTSAPATCCRCSTSSRARGSRPPS